MPTPRPLDRRMIEAFVGREHQELVTAIGRMQRVALEMASLPVDRTSTGVANILRWIDDSLRPHMAWEEAWLLPQVDDQAETPWVTRLIRFDHRQITHEVDRLRTDHALLRQHPSREAIAQVSGDLSGLATLLRADLEREERFLGPLIHSGTDVSAPDSAL